jgi:hypothetical protein
MILHGRERILSKAEAERLIVKPWALAEHTRDRGDECACASCAADDFDTPPMVAALQRAAAGGDRALAARIRTAMRLATRRRRA